jgi:5-methylcytosine-specific restriction enzyme A
MKRLRSLPPLVRPLPSLLPQPAGTGFARTDGKTAAERGYGADWRRVRAEVLRNEPFCRMCKAPATDVDHIAPFQGLADPRRLALTNLRPLCAPCHRRRTAAQSNRRE